MFHYSPPVAAEPVIDGAQDLVACQHVCHLFKPCMQVSITGIITAETYTPHINSSSG
jgi:hypothetical protein